MNKIMKKIATQWFIPVQKYGDNSIFRALLELRNKVDEIVEWTNEREKLTKDYTLSEYINRNINETIDQSLEREKPIDKCCGTCKFSNFQGICISKKIAAGCMEFPIERKFWEPR